TDTRTCPYFLPPPAWCRHRTVCERRDGAYRALRPVTLPGTQGALFSCASISATAAPAPHPPPRGTFIRAIHGPHPAGGWRRANRLSCRFVSPTGDFVLRRFFDAQ